MALTKIPGFALDPLSNVTFANGNITGNLTSNNITVASTLNTAGNITGAFFIGNGSQLTGISGGIATAIANGNSNVNIFTANGNVTIAAVGNTTMTVTGTGVNVAGTLNTTGNIIVGAASGGNITGGNVIGANTGNFSANVTAAYFLGNGSQLTGISVSSNSIFNGNSNVSVATANGNVTVAAVGNTVMTITGTGVNVVGTLNTGSGNINTTGNVSGAFFIGNGSQLTGIAGGGGGSNIANGNSNVNIATANGNITMSAVGNANVVVVTGTGVNVAGTLNTTGNIIVGAASGGNITGGNVIGANTGNFSANVTAAYFLGNGSQLTGISVASVSNGNSNVNIATANGNVTIAAVGNTTITVTGTGANIFGYANVTGNISAGNVNAGNLLTANYSTAVLTTAAQPNITSVGTLTSLAVTGNTTSGNFIGRLANGNSNVSIATANGNVTLTAVGNTVITVTGTGVNVAGTLNTGSGNITGGNIIGPLANGTSNVVVASSSNVSVSLAGVSNAAVFSMTVPTSGSISFNGGYLVAPDNASYAFGTGDFTVEGWLYPTAAPYSGATFIVIGSLSTGIVIGYQNTTTWGLASNGGAFIITSTTLPTQNSWNHFAVTRSAGTAYLFLNGTLLASGASSQNFPSMATFIGHPAPVQTVNGYLSNLRFVKGVAVYTSAFIPPTNALTSTQSANVNGIPSAAITSTSTGLLLNTVNDASFLSDSSSYNLTITNSGTSSLATAPAWAGFGTLNATYGVFATSVNAASLTSGALSVTGTVNLTSASNVSLGAVGNVKITGGTSGQVIQTDGSGNLSFVAISSSGISNGNSNVNIATANGNVTIAAVGNTTMTVTGTGANIFGYANVTGNISAGNVSATTFTGALSGAATSATTAGTVTTAAQPNITSVGTLTSLAVTGNTTSGNFIGIFANGNSSISIPAANGNIIISATGAVNEIVITSTGVNVAGTLNATGNVTANFFIGNGSQLTGIAGGGGASIANGNSNVNIATANGNVTIAAVGNANVVVVTGTGVNVAGALNTSGNLIIGSATGGNLNGANVINANTGNFSSNVTAAFFIGNGSQITGITSVTNITNGNSNVSIATANGNVTIAAVGNTTMTVTGTGVNVAGALNTSGNLIIGSATGGNLNGANVINANTGIFSANVSAGNLITGSGGGGSITGANLISANFTVANALTVAGAASGVPNVSTIAGNLGLRTVAATYTDTSAAATVANAAIHAIATPTIVGSNAMTYTNLATFYIQANPTAGTNATVTNSYAMFVGSGNSFFGGNILGTLANGNSNVNIATANGNVTLTAVGNTTMTVTGTGVNVAGTLNTGTGNLTAGNISTAGNLTFSSNAQRILGDFDNATIANRLMFQTTTANGSTNIYIIPNGTGVNTSFTAVSNSNPTNASIVQLAATSTDMRISSSRTGSGTYLPFTILTSAAERFRIDINGNVGIGNAAPTDNLSVTGTTAVSGNISTAGNLILSSTGQRILGDFGNATVTSRPMFQASATNSNTNLYAIPNGTGNLSSFTAASNSNLGNTSTAQLIASSTDSRLQSGQIGTGTYVPLTFYTSASERVRIDINGNVGIGNTAPTNNLSVTGTAYVSGNLTAGNLLGVYANGNSNVNIPAANGNVNISAVGNANVVVVTGTGVNVAGTLNTGSGNINTTGNVSGAFFLGNGSQLTGISGGGGSSIANGNSNVNIATANGNITMSAVGNANIVTVTGTGVNVAGILNATGNVTGAFFIGNGSQLTGISGGGGTSIAVDNFTGNGVQTAFVLSTTPTSKNQTSVNYNGATVLRSDYTLLGSTITFSSAPANSSLLEITTINITSGGGGTSAAPAVGYSLIFGG